MGSHVNPKHRLYNFPQKIKTQKGDYIDAYLDENGGMIKLAYVLEMGNMVNSFNELCIKVGTNK